MSAPVSQKISRRVAGQNVWLGYKVEDAENNLARLPVRAINPEVLETEEAVGRAQLEEIRQAASRREGDLVIILLGGRGAQGLYHILGQLAQTSEADELLGRLHVFTQAALAPMSMDHGMTFVRDFVRMLGDAFLSHIMTYTTIST